MPRLGRSCNLQNSKWVTGILALTFLFAANYASNIAAGNGYYPNLSKWNYVLYHVTDFNQTASVAWFTDTGQAFKWRANVSSHVLYEFQFVGGKGPSPYDPNKIQAWGNIYIGNLTRQHVTMYEIASNLALSIYPWYPGFLTGVNWTSQKQQAQNGTNTLVGTLTVTNGTGTYFGRVLKTITFDFKQKSKFQNTTLTYDMTTGALVYGKASAGNYRLELVAIDSDFIASSTATSLSPMQILAITLSVTVGLIVINKRVDRTKQIRNTGNY